MDSALAVPSDPAHIRSESSAGVLRLTIVHPRARNALTAAMLQTLTDALLHLPNGTRVVVLTGDGSGAFSSGADLRAITDSESVAAMREAVSCVVAAVESCPAPTIASIDGLCIGAAIELVLAADLRVCSAGSVFRLPAARLGIDYPRQGLARYVDAIGLTATTRIALLGEKIEAADAATWGLVHAVAADAVALDALVIDWTERLLQGDPTAVSGMRASLRGLRVLQRDEPDHAG